MSDPSSQSGRPATLHLALLGVLGLAIVAAAVTVALRHGEPPVQVTSSAERMPPMTPAVPPAQTPVKPSFDIVRINPQGDTVIAGRATPGAQVSIQEGGKEIGSAQADQQGAWVFVPTERLAPGGQELTLSQRDAAGHETKADQSVLVVVPPAPGSPGVAQGTADQGTGQGTGQSVGPVAVLSTPGAAPRVLQAPSANPSGAGARLALDALEYDDRGQVRFAGSAPPGSPVRVYVDNQPIGDAAAGPDGRWSLTPRAEVAPGDHELRVDQLSGSGGVAARVATPFHREQIAAADIGKDRVVVQSGHSLWRLARLVYGSGVHYMVIYQANRDLIRDPNKIYPGQAFNIPSLSGALSGAVPGASSASGTGSGPAGAVTPASSSKSR
jgi:nucleoid-associated protein YgaU